jgi:hypothetical protein
MTTTLVFNEEEHQEALDAINASSMKVAAWEFDQKLRGIVKYGQWPTDWPEDKYDLLDRIRMVQRECWEKAGVNFDN